MISSILIKFYFSWFFAFNSSSKDCFGIMFDIARHFKEFCVDLNLTKSFDWMFRLFWLFDTSSRTYFLSLRILSLSFRISTVKLLLKLWVSEGFSIESSSILMWFVVNSCLGAQAVESKLFKFSLLSTVVAVLYNFFLGLHRLILTFLSTGVNLINLF